MTEPEDGVVVPWERIEPAILRRLAEDLVTRDGTDYGAHEATLDRKVDDVLQQLRRGEAVVVWDAATESANIVPRRSVG